MNFYSNKDCDSFQNDSGTRSDSNSSSEHSPNTTSVYRYSINDLSSTTENTNERHFCEVCGDESDGLHFGQYTCRACAAFFRRTVSLKLEYACKHDANCSIEKSARNMCRQCRYQKCLKKGMLTSAVQHARDGLGKRISSKKSPNTSFSETPDLKIAKSVNSEQDLATIPQSNMSILTSSALSSVTNGILQIPSNIYSNSMTATAALSVLQPHQETSNLPITESTTISNPGSEILLMDASNGSIFQLNSVNSSASSTTTSSIGSFMTQNLLSEDSVNTNKLLSPYLQLGHTITAPGSAFTAIHQNDLASSNSSLSKSNIPANINEQLGGMKYLSRMLQGYQHFVSLRKASYTLIDGQPRFRDNEEIPQSNFGTSKKICKIEASLIMDTVENFFVPFNTLSSNDKNLLFDSFYCVYSNTERAFRTYKLFDGSDDRLIMPDGGYLRLSELEKFYENNTLVRGNPQQVAKIFEDAIDYLINVVVSHMRRIRLTDIELMALFGLFIWRDTVNVSPETMQIVLSTRDNILVDLHTFYRLQGYIESEITVRTANLLLLMPKLEHVAVLMREDYDVAIMFNIMSVDEVCPLVRNLRL